jgi:Asp/Glu/hydantoin racemase
MENYNRNAWRNISYNEKRCVKIAYKYKVGLIRVVTLTDEKILNVHGRIIERLFPEIKVISRSIEDQPKGIYDKETEKKAIPKILRIAEEFEKENMDAIIISCAADPGVKEARRKLKIPVIGAGSAVASLSLSYGNRIGVLNLNEGTPEIIKDVLGSHLVAEEYPRNIRNTLDLMTNEGMEEALKALKRLLDKNIDVIILGCTGYSTIGFIEYARKITPKPMIDPVIATGIVTLGILKNRGGLYEDQSK